jgi:hypothetical protein
MQGSRTTIVFLVDAGAIVHQQLRRALVSSHACSDQGSAAVPVSLVEAAPVGQQHLDHGFAAICGGNPEGAATISVNAQHPLDL